MTVTHIHTREADKHALDAHHATDALANAENMDRLHKRMRQLTDIYTTAMTPLLECTDASTDEGMAKEFLDGLQDLCGDTFDTLPNAAQTIRETVRREG